MLEEIYNLFYFASNDDKITHVGIATHKVNGTEEDKIKHLKNHIYSDAVICEHYDVDPRALGEDKVLSNSRFMAMARVGNPFIVFEIALQAKNASQYPLMIYTAIKNGQVQIDASIKADKEVRRSDFASNSVLGVKEMPDYLDKYFVDRGFKFKELLVDDHVKPIHLLFNNKHYLSSIKLLMSFIDTLGYLEFGAATKTFPKWLDKYCDLTSLKITSSELYELRHSLLHMTNLNSHKVMQGKERRISYSIAPRGTPTRTHSGIIFFNYVDFIPIFEAAMNKWIATYDSEKLTTFVERYDQILRENY